MSCRNQASGIPFLRWSEPPYLRKGASQWNYKNCKVDISTRQGRSGSAGVKPLLLHYIIKTYNVKLRCHADNIIVSLYGRNQSVTRCSPPLRWGRTKARWSVYVHIFVEVVFSNHSLFTSWVRVSHSFVCFPRGRQRIVNIVFQSIKLPSSWECRCSKPNLRCHAAFPQL